MNPTQFDQLRRAVPITLLFAAMLTFAPMTALAEVLTLDCDIAVLIFDLSAGTGMFKPPTRARASMNGDQQTDQETVAMTNPTEPTKLTKVVITASTISFSTDHNSWYGPMYAVYGANWKIDRTTGHGTEALIFSPSDDVRDMPYAWVVGQFEADSSLRFQFSQ